MKKIFVSLAGLLIQALFCGPAAAWSHAGRWGTASGGGGSWSASGYRGGSASGGEGSWNATGAYGGHASGSYGSGWSATSAYGGTATHTYGSGYTTYTSPYGATAYHSPYYGAYYPAYHPPTTVDYYGSSCYNCGGWSTAGAAAAGAAVGIAVGAAAASANTSAATSSAYNAGVAAGMAASPTYAMGAIYTTLPAGCATPNVQGKTYYLCGNTWFQPSYGANGVYYRVVPTP
ncbi:MAG: hypothetical protein L0099_01115 [Acidobacteria bacterium]|nr:hypothetical protein [Acidobacteriota bacterium]